MIATQIGKTDGTYGNITAIGALPYTHNSDWTILSATFAPRYQSLCFCVAVECDASTLSVADFADKRTRWK